MKNPAARLQFRVALLFAFAVLSVLPAVGGWAQPRDTGEVRRYAVVGNTGVQGFESRKDVIVAGLRLDREALVGAGAPVDFEVAGSRAYLLYESGEIQGFGEGPTIEGAVINVGRAVDLEIAESGETLFVLDDAGGLQVVAGPNPAWLPTLLNTVEAPVALAVVANGAYVLDSYGVVHAFGGAPALVSPSDEPLARDLEIGPDGRLYMLDALGQVLLLAANEAPRTVLESAPESSLAVDLNFDPVTQEPVVLFENGRTRHRHTPLPVLPESDFRDLEFLPADDDTDWLNRRPTRLAFGGDRLDVNLLDGAFRLPIRIENAWEVSFLDFRLQTGPLLSVRNIEPAQERLLGDAAIKVDDEEDGYRFRIDCGASPDAPSIQGSGTLFHLWLTPGGQGTTAITIDQALWAMRGSTAFGVSPEAVSLPVAIRNPEPAARMVLLPGPGIVVEDQAGSRAGAIRGATVVAEVQIESVSGLAGISLDFAFDSDRLRLVSLTDSGVLEEVGPVIRELGDLNAINQAGRGRGLTVSILGDTGGFRGRADVFMLSFALTQAGLARIELEEIRAIDTAGQIHRIPVRSHPLELEVR